MTKVKLAVTISAMATTLLTQAQEVQMNTESDVHTTIQTMTTAFAEGNINKLMSTYAADAVVVGGPGKPPTGDAALRAMFASYVEAGVAFDYGAHEVVVAGDTALHLMKWTAPQPDGGKASALSVAVLRRQADGHWKMVIDHPFGDAVMTKE